MLSKSQIVSAVRNSPWPRTTHVYEERAADGSICAVCAVGAIVRTHRPDAPSVYSVLDDLIPPGIRSRIYRWNDNEDSSFAEIADCLEALPDEVFA